MWPTICTLGCGCIFYPMLETLMPTLIIHHTTTSSFLHHATHIKLGGILLSLVPWTIVIGSIFDVSQPSEPYTTSASHLDSYKTKPTLFTTPLSSMDRAPPNPFQGGWLIVVLCPFDPSFWVSLLLDWQILVLVDPFSLHTLLLVCYPLMVAPLMPPWFLPYHHSCMG